MHESPFPDDSNDQMIETMEINGCFVMFESDNENSRLSVDEKVAVSLDNWC